MKKTKRLGKLTVNLAVDVDLLTLAQSIISSLSFPDVERFIVLLDKECQDWGVTDNLIRHFKALEQKSIEEIEESEEHDLSPKEIEV